jgi:hypothetical protein
MNHRIIVSTVLLIILTAAANTVTAAQHHAGSSQCSARIIKGTYGYNGGGMMESIEFRSIGTAIFDGLGNFTWTSSDFPGEVMSGTYEINADCTGTAVYSFPEWLPAPASSSKIVVVENGKEFYVVPEPPALFVPSTRSFTYKRQ